MRPFLVKGSKTFGRSLELVGAFVLGGGVVALAYELGRGRTGEDLAIREATVSLERSPAEDEEAPSAQAVYLDPEADAVALDLPPHRVPDEHGRYTVFPPIFAEPVPMDAAAEEAFPQHGVVTSLAAIVRIKPTLDSPMLGTLRGGSRIRLDAERTFGGGCSEGWHRVYPNGWICRAAGIKIAAEPIEPTTSVPQPDLDAPLPYEYWRVNEEMTPFFHRLPTFTEQDRADAAGKAWYAEHKREPMPTDPAARPGDVPSVVKEYMNAGYYVTKAGEETRSERRFLRTTRGAYARKYQLGQKTSPSFRGQVLAHGSEDLPIHFITRELAFVRRESEGSDVLVTTEEVPERLSTHPFVRMLEIGPQGYYEDGEGRLLRAYAVGKAYKLKRPPGVGADEHWIHVDLSEQTLVAYIGDVPVFATLVSTGKTPGLTPVGVHRIQIKHIATSMRDQPQEDEAYSIDDVPWTQYFAGSIALHGAFWHAGFGLVRSHGCVNLSPSDARWLFGFTSPLLRPGWHAAAPNERGDRGSPVVVTE